MILIMGIAGSGKGTQSKLLADNHDYHLVTVGDVLRQNASDKQRQKMQSGILLDDQETIEIVDGVLSSSPDTDHILLDGFPRTLPQAEWLIGEVEKGRFKLQTAFHLVATREAVKRRLLDRARTDDVDQAIEQRFDEYEKSTAPILDWLRTHNIDVYDVDAERSIEAVNADIVKHLKQS
jgi:adenylate kinase